MTRNKPLKPTPLSTGGRARACALPSSNPAHHPRHGDGVRDRLRLRLEPQSHSLLPPAAPVSAPEP